MESPANNENADTTLLHSHYDFTYTYSFFVKYSKQLYQYFKNMFYCQ